MADYTIGWCYLMSVRIDSIALLFVIHSSLARLKRLKNSKLWRQHQIQYKCAGRRD